MMTYQPYREFYVCPRCKGHVPIRPNRYESVFLGPGSDGSGYRLHYECLCGCKFNVYGERYYCVTHERDPKEEE